MMDDAFGILFFVCMLIVGVVLMISMAVWVIVTFWWVFLLLAVMGVGGHFGLRWLRYHLAVRRQAQTHRYRLQAAVAAERWAHEEIDMAYEYAKEEMHRVAEKWNTS